MTEHFLPLPVSHRLHGILSLAAALTAHIYSNTQLMIFNSCSKSSFVQWILLVSWPVWVQFVVCSAHQSECRLVYFVVKATGFGCWQSMHLLVVVHNCLKILNYCNYQCWLRNSVGNYFAAFSSHINVKIFDRQPFHKTHIERCFYAFLTLICCGLMNDIFSLLSSIIFNSLYGLFNH